MFGAWSDSQPLSGAPGARGDGVMEHPILSIHTMDILDHKDCISRDTLSKHFYMPYVPLIRY